MKLARLAKVVRSKNAGPFFMTFDIMFEDKDSYERVLDSMVINKKVISELYGVSEEVIDIINYEPAYAIKIAFPRQYSSGSFNDTDVYGAQQYVHLLNLEID